LRPGGSSAAPSSLDRFIGRLCDTDNIREVIAFPKAGNGYDPLMDAPSIVDDKQLKELNLSVVWPAKKAGEKKV
jgi:aspartyl-tRNA synthetase